jgi:inorganic pyrophosphatase
MADVLKLDNKLDPGKHTCRAVVETPKGARSKYDYEPELGAYQLKGLLPEGMVFPMDFGFIPSTLGEDGDPLDVMILADEPGTVGTVVDVRLVGVIQANQTEGDSTLRNDRLIAVAAVSLLYDRVQTIQDLGEDFVRHQTEWWVQYNAMKDKRFEVLNVGGPEEAVKCVQGGLVKD